MKDLHAPLNNIPPPQKKAMRETKIATNLNMLAHWGGNNIFNKNMISSHGRNKMKGKKVTFFNQNTQYKNTTNIIVILVPNQRLEA